MTYVFDIDGTICMKSEEGNDYEQAVPIKERIDKVNKLYNDGNTIIYLTARGMGRHKNNKGAAIIDFYDTTARQLKEWGAQYHKLFLGKPAGDIYIDDKGMNDEDFFKDDICP